MWVTRSLYIDFSAQDPNYIKLVMRGRVIFENTRKWYNTKRLRCIFAKPYDAVSKSLSNEGCRYASRFYISRGAVPLACATEKAREKKEIL